MRGLEPPRLATLDSHSSVAAITPHPQILIEKPWQIIYLPKFHHHSPFVVVLHCFFGSAPNWFGLHLNPLITSSDYRFGSICKCDQITQSIHWQNRIPSLSQCPFCNDLFNNGFGIFLIDYFLVEVAFTANGSVISTIIITINDRHKFGTLGGIRTCTCQFLRLMTLPVGLPGHIWINWNLAKFEFVLENRESVFTAATCQTVCWPPIKHSFIWPAFFERPINCNQLCVCHKIFGTWGPIWTVDFFVMSEAFSPTELPRHITIYVDFHCPKICLLSQMPSTVPTAPPRV